MPWLSKRWAGSSPRRQPLRRAAMLHPRSLETRLWREELRATVALAWPLVLTNLTQSLIQSTDVVLLGWAGARTLASATIGINLYYAFLIFGIGLIAATAFGQAPGRDIQFNGRTLTASQAATLASLERMYGVRLPDGAYWYDARCGRIQPW